MLSIDELRIAKRACLIAYGKKDLELRKIRRNKDLIDKIYNDALMVGDEHAAQFQSYNEQIEWATEERKDFRVLSKKIDWLIDREMKK